MDTMVYWIWLSLACSPSGSTFGKLIKEFDGAREIYEAEGRRISSVIGFRNSDRSALEDKSLEEAEKIYHFCRKHNVGLLPYCDERYPQLLREINNPPVLFYYRGTLPDFDRGLNIAVVGTRRLTEYGRKNAFSISYDLASAGATVVSGMALGIDGVAASGAMAAGGRTVAIIGSGIDVCYPSQHLGLAREIVKNGCVMTEFAPGTKPVKHNFPRRNRIISGLCSATLVIEGEETSGALITARCAKEQGRGVYALPGNVGSKTSQLSNLLLQNGAKACTRAEDILRDFEASHKGVINTFRLKEGHVVDMMASLAHFGAEAVCPGDEIFEIPRRRPTTSQNTSVYAAKASDKPKVSSPVKNNNSSYGKKETKASASCDFSRGAAGDRALAKNTEADDEYKAEGRSGVIIKDTPVAINPPASFDKLALRVYKKIPSKGKCSLESLVDEEMDLRAVMKCLLKLEMGGFIVMLPGEEVSRKFKLERSQL